MDTETGWAATTERWVTLTERERDERARTLAAFQTQLREMKHEKSETLREFTVRISEQERAVSDYTDRVIVGVEKRVVSCMIIPNWERGTGTLMDIETGEIIETRPLTDEERSRQYELPLGGDYE